MTETIIKCIQWELLVLAIIIQGGGAYSLTVAYQQRAAEKLWPHLWEALVLFFCSLLSDALVVSKMSQTSRADGLKCKTSSWKTSKHTRVFDNFIAQINLNCLYLNKADFVSTLVHDTLFCHVFLIPITFTPELKPSHCFLFPLFRSPFPPLEWESRLLSYDRVAWHGCFWNPNDEYHIWCVVLLNCFISQRT